MQLKQAILPVAGLGTRFLPWTKVVPKELLPLGNQPIIAHLVDECLDVGITNICFVISHGKEAIPQYFYEDPTLEAELARRGKTHLLEQLQKYDEVNFHTVYQEEQHGDGHALLQAADWVKPGIVAVLFGDDLFTGAGSGLQQLSSAMGLLTEKERGALVALENVPKDQVHRYGIAAIESEHPKNARLKKIVSLVEKPEPVDAPSTFGIVGRYLVPESTFETLGHITPGQGGEIRLIDALITQLNAIPIYGYECEGTRLDTGTPEGYRHAVQQFS